MASGKKVTDDEIDDILDKLDKALGFPSRDEDVVLMRAAIVEAVVLAERKADVERVVEMREALRGLLAQFVELEPESGRPLPAWHGSWEDIGRATAALVGSAPVVPRLDVIAAARKVILIGTVLDCGCSLRERDSGHRVDCWVPDLREAVDALELALDAAPDAPPKIQRQEGT